MIMYTCKKTGQKFTAEEVEARRQANSKRKMRAMFTLGAAAGISLFLGIQAFGSMFPTFDSQFENMSTVKIRLQPNETVWNIAEVLTPEHNTRDVVYAMKSMNEDVNLENAKAFSDVITFYVDEDVDLSALDYCFEN